jgi:hypothetical protein
VYGTHLLLGPPVTAASLKAFISVLAKGVHMTPAALYERQRALVRAGLLHSKGGRGPGSGVRTTPQSVAMLFISVLATGNLSETEERSKVLASLKSATESCPLTGKKMFASALTAVLASEDLAKRLLWIEVKRSGAQAGATMVFRKPPEEIPSDEELLKIIRDPKRSHADKDEALNNTIDSWFGHKRPEFKSMLSVTATLAGPFHAIAHALKEAEKDERQHHPTRQG